LSDVPGPGYYGLQMLQAGHYGLSCQGSREPG